MKRIRQTFLLLIMVMLFVFGCLADQHSRAQATRKSTMVTMNIKGEIVKDNERYIMRGKVPAELFTILNPNPSILDNLVKSGETVTIEAVSVMGDNIDIKKINSKPYKEPE